MTSHNVNSHRKLQKHITEEFLEASPRSATTAASTFECLPSCRLDTPLTVSSIKITEAFKGCAKRAGFAVAQESPFITTVTLTNSFSLRKLVSCCMPFRVSAGATATLHIAINEKKCTRIVYVRGTVGDPRVISGLIQSFSTKMAQLTAERQVLRYAPLAEEEDIVITSKEQANSYYEFYKILSCESYSLGRSLSEFVDSFRRTHQNTEEGASLLPGPVDSLKLKVEETVETLYSDYNFGRGSAAKVMVFCRPAVEKYLFSKLHDIIIELYTRQRSADITQFQAQQKGPRSIYTALHLPAAHCLEYTETLEKLRTLSKLISPQEKAEGLKDVLNTAKAEVLQHSGGACEVNEDSECCVLAATLLLSPCQLLPHLGLLQDWGSPAHRTLLRPFESAINLILAL